MTKKNAPVVNMPKRNPALPRVPITLDGKEYFLQYDFNAICVVEELTGINMFGTLDFTNLSTTKFRAILYASLMKSHPTITLEEAGSFINIHTLPELSVKLIEAWHGSRPEIVKEDKSGNAQAEAEIGL